MCLDCNQRISDIKEFCKICKISQTILTNYFTTAKTSDKQSIIADTKYSAIEFVAVENTFIESVKEDQVFLVLTLNLLF